MKIRTCPFCGQLPKVEGLMKGTDLESYFIKCSNEKCEAAIKNPFKTIKEAVDYWNTRVEPEVRELEDSEEQLPVKNEPQINTEAVSRLYNRVSEKYGDNAIWGVLFLMSQIDMQTWKFPEHIRNTPFGELLDEIEQDEELRDAFKNQNRSEGD